MKFEKQLLALALCAAMLFSFASVASAVTADGAYTFTFVNDGGAPPLPTEQVSVMGEADKTSFDRAVDLLREAMRLRLETVSVTVAGVSVSLPSQQEQQNPGYDDGEYDILNLCADIYAKAIEHTGKPDEGDYIWRNFNRYTADIYPATDSAGSIVSVQYTYHLDFLSNVEQEEEVDKKIEALLNGPLAPAGKTTYEKIKSVYDWICENVDYDNTRTSYSTYDALIVGRSVCQGYASLFYRFMLEMGIDCRYISGKGLGDNGYEPHGWNIVDLDGKYYSVDATWDTAYLDAGATYKYFLRCPRDYAADHTPDDNYDAAFWEKYPRSDYCFGGVPVETVNLSGDALLLAPGSIGAVNAAVLPLDAYCKTIIWTGGDSAIAVVDPVTGDITAIAPGTTVVSAVAAGGVKADVTVTVTSGDMEYYDVDLGDTVVPEEGGAFYAEVTVTKQVDRPGEDVIVMQLCDSAGKTASTAYMKISMELGQSIRFGTEFNAGSGYELKAYVDDSLGADSALSPVSTR